MVWPAASRMLTVKTGFSVSITRRGRSRRRTEPWGSSGRPAAQDFSFPLKEWKQDTIKALPTEPTDNETHSKKSSVRKTMDWSFDTAMSETEKGEPEAAVGENNRAKKHDTMAWSFPLAMAEADASSNPSVTPDRPASILMPVTSSEVDAAEADIPRPSTAMSETVSETSLASSEADP